MKLYEKYPKLQQKKYVTNLIADLVFSTMALENQHISEEAARVIAISLIREAELQGRKFIID